MKVTIIVFAAVVAVAFAFTCDHSPISCPITCPTGHVNVCEHGECECSENCTVKSDCPPCSPETDGMGHIHKEDAECYNNVCICVREHPDSGSKCMDSIDCTQCGAHTDPNGQVHREQAVCIGGHCACSQTHHEHDGH